MWIQTQIKNRIINSDQIIDIFIDKTGTKIYAETTRDGDFFELGYYKNRETCKELLDIYLKLLMRDCKYLVMPLGGDAVSWIKQVKEAIGEVT